MMHFLRKVRATFSNGASEIVINPGPISGVELKIAFEISCGIESSANSARIQLWNLTKEHRNALGKEFDDVTLEAGYEPAGGQSNVGIIFKGQLRDVQHTREGPDIVTTLTSGDGDAALRNAVISKSFKVGTPVSEVIDSLYDELEPYGVDRGEVKLPETVKTKKLERPYAMCGSCSRELDRLGRGHGFYWSIQNGAFEIIPSDEALSGTLVVAPYPQGSMVGTPTITDNGVQVSMLLDPACRPNRTVKIHSEVVEMNGADDEFRISQVRFSGDNRDGDFFATAINESTVAKTGKAKKVDEGKKSTKPKRKKKAKVPEIVL